MMGGEDRAGGTAGGAGSPTSYSGAALAAGTVVAMKYELVQPLGTGGMGVVWAARQLQSQVMVALKFLRAGLGDAEDHDSLKRFLREARAAASVKHPHVVAIREVLELADGQPVIVMELLTGETLRTRLSRGPRLTVEETAGILLPVASAVGTAHAQGIVHRDLKPDNIFLSRDERDALLIKVLDFGIAKVTRVDEHASQPGLTRSGEVLGTPHYMSPEQVFGECDIDHRADVWALGVILYECLSGVVPTRGLNVGQVFKLIVAGGMKPLTSVMPDAPADLAELVHRLLARGRDQRPFDLNEIADVLRRYTRIMVPAFGPPQIPAAVLPPPPTEEPPRRPMSRLTTISLGGLVISLLVGESFLLSRSRNRPADASVYSGPKPASPDAAAAPAVQSSAPR